MSIISVSSLKIFFVAIIFIVFGVFVILSYNENGRNIFTESTSFIKGLNNETNNKIQDKETCNPILLDGNFISVRDHECTGVSAEYTNTNYECMRKWKPNGCSMNFYSVPDVEKCMDLLSEKTKYIYFIGDSRMRYIYNKMVLFIDKKLLKKKFDFDSAIESKEMNLKISFLHQLFMNETFIKRLHEINEVVETHPTIIVIGITLHMIARYEINPQEGIREFENYLTQAKQVMDKLGSKALVLWFVQANKSLSFTIIKQNLNKKTPPHYNSHNSMFKNLTMNELYLRIFQDAVRIKGKHKKDQHYNHFITVYNSIAEKILKGTSVKMWQSAIHIAEHSMDDFMDSVHFSDYDNYNLMQMVFNIFCNKKMNIQ